MKKNPTKTHAASSSRKRNTPGRNISRWAALQPLPISPEVMTRCLRYFKEPQ